MSSAIVPSKSAKTTVRSNKHLRYRRNLTRRRRRIHKILNNTSSPAKKEKLVKELLEIEKNLPKSYLNGNLQKEKTALEAIKKNPKYFYSYAKKSWLKSFPVNIKEYSVSQNM